MPVALLVAWLFTWCIASAAGAYSTIAIAVVLIATLLTLWRYGANLDPRAETVPSNLVAPVVWIGAFSLAFLRFSDPNPLTYPVHPFVLGRAAQATLLLLLLSYLPAMVRKAREPRALRTLRFAAFALCIAVEGRDVIAATPNPQVDVWTVQQAGALALSRGQNPYRVVAERDTGPRVAHDVPYVYPPFQAYVTLPAYLIARDVRFTMLTALVALGVLLRSLTTRGLAEALEPVLEDAPALFVWCGPKIPLILQASWVDPVQALLCAGMVAAAVRERPRLTAVLAGCVLASKQTMFLFVALFGFGLRFTLQQWLLTGAVTAAAYLPWVLWDFRALKHANFDFLTALPARADALTFNTWLQRRLDVNLSPAIAFPAAGSVAAVAAWKLRGSVSRLAFAAVATFTVFFVFNKWANANYYFLLTCFACLATSTALREPIAAQAVSAPPIDAPAAAESPASA